MLRKALPGAVLVAIAAFMAAPSPATTVLPIDLDGLSSYSETILAGTVTEVRSSWSSDRTRIYTDVAFSDVEYLKGVGSDRTYTLRLPGGTVGDLTMKVAGTPSFEVGQRDVLFLHSPGGDQMPIVGWTQGRFRVVDGAVRTDAGARVLGVEDGRLVVARPEAGRVAVEDGSASGGTLAEDAEPVRFQAPRQYADREEELPAGLDAPVIVSPETAGRIAREWGGTDAKGYPIGRGPIVVAADAPTVSAMTEADFLQTVRRLALGPR